MRLVYKYITSKMSETEYVEATTTFKKNTGLNSTALGLSSLQVEQIGDACDAVATALNNWTDAQAAANAARIAKNEAFADTKALVDNFAKIFRADNTIDDSLLAEILVAPHRTPATQSAPVTPTNFTGTANASGEVTLKWKRNGNTSATQFIVESRGSDTGAWTTAGVTNTTKFVVQATPGAYVSYRVRAKKKNVTTSPTSAVSFWGEGASVQLSIAA